MDFVLNGRTHRLDAETVRARVPATPPHDIRIHWLDLDGRRWPPKQAFRVATGLTDEPFTAHFALRVFQRLGFTTSPVPGAAASRRPRRSSAKPIAGPSRSQPPKAHREPSVAACHTEANVQASLVTAIAADGWRILSVANTATKEHGVDVIASRDGQTAGVEVKGFPGRGYADPSRADEVKRTSPSTQAGHWYAQAVLAAMRLRGKEPMWRSVIALPDFPRYRDLHTDTAGSLGAAQIEVWWVDEAGKVQRP